MTKRQFILFYRFGFALLVLVAVCVQLADGLAKPTFSLLNFFSFFTIQSNIFAVMIFIAGALMLARRKSSASLDMLRSAAALYMVMTGIIFAILLSGLQARVQTTIPWVNSVLHEIFPLVLFVDWLFDRPKLAVSFKRALYWAIYPAAYALYSLVRGAAIDWYPYPFLDPREHGYGQVAALSLIIAVAVLAIIYLVSWITRRTAAKTIRAT